MLVRTTAIDPGLGWRGRHHGTRVDRLLLQIVKSSTLLKKLLSSYASRPGDPGRAASTETPQ
jgi:hypothetical protein